MKIIFGAIYKRKHDTCNEQHYYIYIPVAYKFKDGEIKYRMVDTYEAKKQYGGSTKTMESRISYLEQANCGESSGGIYYGPSDYYYKNYYDLPSDELDEKEWEMLGDLHNYKMVDDREVYDYLKEDRLMYIPLWWEDCYRWNSGGVGHHYVKKEAKKDGCSVYRNALSTYSYGFESWNAERMQEVCKDVLENMSLKYGEKKIIKKELKRIRKYLQLYNEYCKFCEELEKEK